MRRAATLLVALLLLGCHHDRPVVVSPQVVVIVNLPDDAKGSGDQTGSNTAQMNLPICYLSPCTGDDRQCASEVSDTLRHAPSQVWELFLRRPDAVVAFAPRGYYAVATRKVPVERIVARWAEVGCIKSGTSLPEGADAARLRECIRNMGTWVTASARSSISALALDQDYKRVCLRDS